MSEKWTDSELDELLKDIDRICASAPGDADFEPEKEVVIEEPQIPEPEEIPAEPVAEEVEVEETVAEPEPEEINESELREMQERLDMIDRIFEADEAEKEIKQKVKEMEKAEKTRKVREKKPNRRVPVVVALLFAIIGLAAIGWAGVTLHTADASEAAPQGDNTPAKTTDLVTRVDKFVYNAKSDAVSDLTYIRKLYSIPENDTIAPKPDESRFGRTTDPAVIQDLIDRSAELLDGQSTVWTPNRKLAPGAEYRYYMDDTILVIIWKEMMDGRCIACCEVKIADASQFRRKITADTYDSGIRTTAREMANEANAVVGMSADFYAFRDRGITVYQRQLYRCAGEILDTCFFTASGEMKMVRAGQLTDRRAAEQFVADNDILFSTSFGPILIEHGQKNDIGWYPIGEINDEYSRAAIGLVDDLHYMFCTINFDCGSGLVGTIYNMQDVMWSMGCYDAYTLDGGQTAELCMQNEIINHIDWGSERQVSDIIYFATAIPTGEGQ